MTDLTSLKYTDEHEWIALDVRGTAIPATVVTLPFYSRKKA